MAHTHQYAYCKEAGPWYFEVKIKALFMYVSASSCSMSPRRTRPSTLWCRWKQRHQQRVVLKCHILAALVWGSRVSRTSSAMTCGWSSPLTIRVRYLARYSSCRAVERRPPAKQYRARWIWTREHICLMRLDGFIEIFSACGSKQRLT